MIAKTLFGKIHDIARIAAAYVGPRRISGEHLALGELNYRNVISFNKLYAERNAESISLLRNLYPHALLVDRSSGALIPISREFLERITPDTKCFNRRIHEEVNKKCYLLTYHPLCTAASDNSERYFFCDCSA